MTIFDLDTVVSAAFELMDEEDVTFLSVRRHGKKNNEEIILYSEDSLEEEVEEWFTNLGDEMHFRLNSVFNQCIFKLIMQKKS